MDDPVELVVKKLPYGLSNHGGLTLVGRLLTRINHSALIDLKHTVETMRGGIGNSNILKCIMALLILGRSDFEAVEGFR